MIKTSELTGAKLNYWVAKAEGLQPRLGENGNCYTFDGKYCSSTDWAQGGPIIERERIEVMIDGTSSPGWWVAQKNDHNEWSRSYLEAAMRCFVASKFGDEVPGE